MSKALVIKGANFAQNAVEQISISDPIPCTGITISQNSISFTEIGATATLTATVAPIDTTEAVTWHSSDENVVTVNNGVVTCIGVGSATITATCGTQSAQCTVTATASFNANDKFRLNGYRIGTTNLDADPPRDYLGVSAAAQGCIFTDPINYLNGYKAFSGNNASIGMNDKYPFVLPQNTSKISILADAAFKYAQIGILDANKKNAYDTSSNGGALCVAYSGETALADGYVEYLIPEGVDGNSFAFGLRTGANSSPAADITGDVTVTFS